MAAIGIENIGENDKERIVEINDIGKVYEKAQRYANTGFKLLEGMMEKAENVVRLEMLQELDQMYEEYLGQ